jgi:hypothetical protein
MVDNIVEGLEDAVREPIVAHELPDIFLRVQFRAFGRQWNQRDVGRDDQAAGEMPSGLIDQKRRMGVWGDLCGDLGQVEVHRLSVASRHDERRALAVFGTDRAEDIGRRGSLVFRRARAGAAFGPAARDLVFLADARFVRKPDLYGVGLDAFFASDLFQARGETFLKSSMAPAACA